MKYPLGVGLAVIAVLIQPLAAEAAAPWLVIVSGDLVAQPVLLDDWDENAELMRAISEPAGLDRTVLEGRDYLDVALFWGGRWEGYSPRMDDLESLARSEANQRGRFYPAAGPRQPALFFLLGWTTSVGSTGTLRAVDTSGLGVLEGRGVPVHLELGEPTDSPSSTLRAGVVSSMLAIGASLFVFLWRRRSHQVIGRV